MSEQPGENRDMQKFETYDQVRRRLGAGAGGAGAFRRRAEPMSDDARLVGILETAIGRAHQGNKLFAQITEDSANAILERMRGVAALEAENARLESVVAVREDALRALSDVIDRLRAELAAYGSSKGAEKER